MKPTAASDIHISMTFRCDVKDDMLSETGCGHFCHQCEKNVIDFRHFSPAEVRRYAAKNGATCGTFTSRQVDPNYIRPITPAKRLRSLAFLSGLFVLIGGADGLAQTTIDPKKEQSQGTSNAPNFTPEEAEEAQQKGTPVSMSIGEAVETTDATTQETVEETTATKERKYHYGRHNRWYFSKKFPFVKKERLWRGKF